jgi:hypothetical protein
MDYLQAHGSLTNRLLLDKDGLNVKRSSFVCALLARLPNVQVSATQTDHPQAHDRDRLSFASPEQWVAHPCSARPRAAQSSAEGRQAQRRK